MIRTSYYSNIKNIPNNFLKIGISRYKPKWLTDELDLHITSLSPSKSLLKLYKDMKITFDDFKCLFEAELYKDNGGYKTLIELSKSEEDIVLLCYEKEYDSCHRKIISYLLNLMYCCDVKEL